MLIYNFFITHMSYINSKKIYIKGILMNSKLKVMLFLTE